MKVFFALLYAMLGCSFAQQPQPMGSRPEVALEKLSDRSFTALAMRALGVRGGEWRHAETLIMETTLGLPKHRMPPAEQVLAEMVEWCRAALADGVTPVLLGYALGKAQEIICALIAAGLVPMLHHKVWQMTQLYHELRPDFPKGSVRFDAGDPKGKVLVFPPHLAREKVLDRIKKKRTAVVTGWALDKNVTYRYGCDAAFPLSDHADYDELLRYVELVQPKRVLTVHGFAAEFAADLRRRGIEAWALAQENQLELTLPQ